MNKQFALVGPGERHELSMTRTTCIGRGKGNHIALNDSHVSRQHAEIFFDGASFILQDLNSNNGSYVNDQRVSSRKLALNDRIRFGAHVYELRSVSDTEKAEEEMAASDTMVGTSPLNFHCPNDDFRGVLGAISVVELCQLLHMGARTGLLTIQEAGGRKALLYFLKGEIIGAETAESDGDAVVFLVLSRKTGQFVFTNGEFAPAKQLQHKTSYYLLEAMRLQDEKKS